MTAAILFRLLGIPPIFTGVSPTTHGAFFVGKEIPVFPFSFFGFNFCGHVGHSRRAAHGAKVRLAAQRGR
jgi:hypothetical protein